ncbi:MAG TPA: RNA 2',3'-cyclic phosphodiesterase [Actinotalea sp.]
MRLFAAVLPPPAALDHLDTALTAVRSVAQPRDSRGPVRWTDPSQHHLTLAFYGEVPDGAAEDLVEALAVVADDIEPFSVALRGAGLFDSRTLWIGCAGDTAELARLTAGAVAVGGEVVGRADDRVRSRAHLTVARVAARAQSRRRPDRSTGPGAHDRARHSRVDAAAEVAALVQALAVYEGPSWTVTEVALVQSQLGAGASGRPRHDVIARLPLRPVAG